VALFSPNKSSRGSVMGASKNWGTESSEFLLTDPEEKLTLSVMDRPVLQPWVGSSNQPVFLSQVVLEALHVHFGLSPGSFTWEAEIFLRVPARPVASNPPTSEFLSSFKVVVSILVPSNSAPSWPESFKLLCPSLSWALSLAGGCRPSCGFGWISHSASSTLVVYSGAHKVEEGGRGSSTVLGSSQLSRWPHPSEWRLKGWY
jgi:hypothetical protein